jgi:hypothetical protein
MALQHLRSSTANKRPTPAVMSDGQLAMNTNLASPGLFLKDSNGDLVKIGPVHVGTTAPNATPGAGGQAGNSKGEQWLDTTGGVYVFKIYDGTAWRSETGTFVDVNGDTMTGALGIIAGSAAAPGVFFSGDTNTGIYSPGADQVAVSTGGTGRLFVDASGKVGIGASSPRVPLQVNTTTQFDSSLGRDTNALNLILESGGTQGDGEYSTGVTFSKINSDRPGAAISAVQTTSDNDTLGLAFLVHESSGTSDVLVEKVRINHAGNVGIGTTTAQSLLNLKKDANSTNPGNSASIVLTNKNTTLNGNIAGGIFVDLYRDVADPCYSGGIWFTRNSEIGNASSSTHIVFGAQQSGGSGLPSEKARIDASGRLLVGTSSSRDNLFNTAYSALFQVESQATANAQASLTSTTAGVNGANLILCHQRSGSVGGNTVVQSDDQLGILSFQGADGTEMVPAASIEAYVDGTPGANDMPGRLVF